MLSYNHIQEKEKQIADNQNEQRKHENSRTRRVPFTSEEDQLLLDLYERYRKKWKKISLHFVNRAPTS